MKIFRQRETLVQNIAFMSIMAAINVIFAFLTALVPLLFFLLVFVLPLTSTLVWIFCKKRYFPIYAFATIGLSMIVNVMGWSDVIFYIIPSIISGLVFGILIDKKIPTIWMLFIVTLVQVVLTYAAFPLIKLLVEVDTVENVLVVFKLSEFEYKEYLPPVFIFIIAIVQTGVSYMVIKEEIKSFGVEIEYSEEWIPLTCIFPVFLCLMSYVFAWWVYPPIAFLMFAIAVYFAVYLTFYIFTNRGLYYKIGLGIAAFLTFILFVLAYGMFDFLMNMFVIEVYVVLTAIIVMIKYIIDRKAQHEKAIDEENKQ